MKDPDAFKMKSAEESGGEYVRRLVRDLKLTPEQAAGLVGNLLYESQEFRTLQEIKPLVPGSRGGAGIAQWTGPRRRNFENWARNRGLAVNTDEANYGFMLHELKGSHASFTSRLRDTGTIGEASRLTHIVYECPADVLDRTYRSGPAREALALRALDGAQEIGSKPPPDLPPEPPEKLVKALASLARAAKKAQKELTAFGFDTGPADGDWGQNSRAAWLAYRRAYPS